ncbi:MAG: hypothetical protein WBX19_14585 [Terracidiphilus sp.]
MRRAISILFVVLFGLGPLAATIDGDDGSLPACCRRHGAHHCAMSDTILARAVQAALRTPGFTAPSHCPQYPIQGNAAPSPKLVLARVPTGETAEIAERLPVSPSGAKARSIHLRTPALRGPPAPALIG